MKEEINHWESVAVLGATQQPRQQVTDQVAAAIGQDGLPVGQARTVLLVAPGRKSSNAAADWQYGAVNLGATAACGITETGRQEEEFINNEARD